MVVAKERKIFFFFLHTPYNSFIHSFIYIYTDSNRSSNQDSQNQDEINSFWLVKIRFQIIIVIFFFLSFALAFKHSVLHCISNVQQQQQQRLIIYHHLISLSVCVCVYFDTRQNTFNCL